MKATVVVEMSVMIHCESFGLNGTNHLYNGNYYHEAILEAGNHPQDFALGIILTTSGLQGNCLYISRCCATQVLCHSSVVPLKCWVTGGGAVM